MTPLKRLGGFLYEKPRGFVYRQVYVTAQEFISTEASSGIVLLLAAVVALIWANSPWDASYFDLWHTHVSIDTDIVHIDLDLQEWVNDGLMTLFFFVAGLEIKRELVRGDLSTPSRAFLPAAAALGGMIAPALIFLGFNAGQEGVDGWGVPMATDIAFAVGVLSLLSRRIPSSLRSFLLALAIADDIGSILVIAVFYTSEIDYLALGFAALMLACAFACNRAGVRTINVYVAIGALLWVGLLESGVHATLTGVLLGLLTPASSHYNPLSFEESAEDIVHRYRLAAESGNEEGEEQALQQMEDLAKGTAPVLERLERALVGWVSFLIVPLFALANAGVHIDSEVADAAIRSPVAQGVALGLVIGKPLGIFLFTWLAVRLRLCEKPEGASWSQLLGVGMIAGIGFTISLLISDLAFQDSLLGDEAKLGVLAGSTIAGVIGYTFLRWTSRNHVEAGATA
ncbi:MAG TPA: Na+/H+ antiporter NhaA [Dehalococcoidia bacterium]|nr:Na+/H+ antiporter NhaA [Dehalococcoidia bacterium]